MPHSGCLELYQRWFYCCFLRTLRFMQSLSCIKTFTSFMRSNVFKWLSLYNKFFNKYRFYLVEKSWLISILWQYLLRCQAAWRAMAKIHESLHKIPAKSIWRVSGKLKHGKTLMICTSQNIISLQNEMGNEERDYSWTVLLVKLYLANHWSAFPKTCRFSIYSLLFSSNFHY